MPRPKKQKELKLFPATYKKNAIGSARHAHRINLIAKIGILRKKLIKYIKSFISFFGTFSGQSLWISLVCTNNHKLISLNLINCAELSKRFLLLVTVLI